MDPDTLSYGGLGPHPGGGRAYCEVNIMVVSSAAATQNRLHLGILKDTGLQETAVCQVAGQDVRVVVSTCAATHPSEECIRHKSYSLNS